MHILLLNGLFPLKKKKKEKEKERRNLHDSSTIASQNIYSEKTKKVIIQHSNKINRAKASLFRVHFIVLNEF